MSLLENNLKIISTISPRLADRIRSAVPEHGVYTVETSKSGEPTLKINTDAKKIYLHSRYDPLKEAFRTAGSAVKGTPDMIVIGGFGLGYLVEEVVRRFPQSTVVVIERSPEVIRTALCSRDLRSLFRAGKIDLVVSESMEDVVPLLEGRATRHTSMLIHRASADLYPEFYGNLKNILHSFLNSKEVNLATLTRFEGLWTRNLLRNFHSFCSRPGVKRLKNLYKGVPAFVVGAGPSLSMNIHLLKDAAEKGVVIAVDTVYKVLLKHGITPHYVVAVDPQLINVQYFQGVKETGTVLIADSAVSPTLVSNFKGETFLSAVPFPFAGWFQVHLEKKGALSSGGSVSTTAFDLAVQMGCTPITLVGQDLAYSDGRIHIKGATGEELWENSAHRLTPVTRSTLCFLNKNRTVRIPAFGGEGEVWSDRKFLTFLWWFERKIPQLPDRTVWNATEGGAAIRGAESRKLARVLAELPKCRILQPEAAGRAEKDLQRFRRSITGLESYLAEVEAASSEGLAICKKMLRRKGDPEPGLLARLDRIDGKIRNDPVYSSLLSSTLQAVIHSVGEGFAINGGEDLSSDTASILKQSLALYEAVQKASLQLSGYLVRYLIPQLSI